MQMERLTVACCKFLNGLFLQTYQPWAFLYNVSLRTFAPTILDRVKWEIEAPLPPIQWCTRAITKTRHFSHHWNGGRGGLNFSSILSKIVVLCSVTNYSFADKISCTWYWFPYLTACSLLQFLPLIVNGLCHLSDHYFSLFFHQKITSTTEG